jgi:hypothetical protein
MVESARGRVNFASWVQGWKRRMLVNPRLCCIVFIYWISVAAPASSENTDCLVVGELKNR